MGSEFRGAGARPGCVGGGLGGAVLERRAPTQTTPRNPLPQENAQPSHRRGPAARAPSAGSPCRLSSTRRGRPRAGGHALLSAVPKAGGLLRSRKRGQAQGVHALPPRLPAAFLLAALAEVARPADSPSPASPTPGSWLPAALTWARARAGGGGVPAAHRAAGRRSGARSRRPQLPGAETEAEGGASPAAGGARGQGARGGRHRPPQTRAGQGAAETAGHPGPRPGGTPPGPPVTSATARRPIRSLLRAPRPGIGRHSEGAGV